MSRRSASPDVVSTRTAVRSALGDLAEGAVVLVACSGGADSLALAAALAWTAERSGIDARAVVVDHGLQDGSAQVAARAAETCTLLGLATEVRRVEVGTRGGPEGAARDARYAALSLAAADAGAAAVLLGHTRDDQAETVLLRLTRGSGARSLSAMAARSGRWRRPFLGLSREAVRSAAAEVLTPLGRTAWEDPHNDDPIFLRVRVRRLLAELGGELGPGVVLGLARSADLLRDDADALDALAESAVAAFVVEDDGVRSGSVAELAALAAAVRTRVLRLVAMQAGAPGEDLGVDLVRRLDALIVDWHGQGEVALPGGVVAGRTYGRLWLRSTRPPEGDARGAGGHPLGA